MLTLNIGPGRSNKQPAGVSTADWRDAQQSEIKARIAREELNPPGSGNGIHLMFLQEVKDNGAGNMFDGIEAKTGLLKLASTGLGSSKAVVLYDQNEWQPIEEASPFTFHTPATGFSNKDYERLFQLQNKRICSGLLRPKDGDFLRRFFGGAPVPPSARSDLASIKVLAMSAHLPSTLAPDVNNRKQYFSVLLRALCSYANEHDTFAIIGADFNLSKEDINVEVSRLDPTVQRQIKIRFPNELLGCRANLSNIDGFIFITPTHSVEMSPGWRLLAGDRAVMEVHTKYRHPDSNEAHFLFDHEPVFLDYRLEHSSYWTGQQIFDLQTMLLQQQQQ